MSHHNQPSGSEAYALAEARFQSKFAVHVGGISLHDIAMPSSADSPDPPLDRFALAALTSLRSDPSPSRTPLGHDVSIPEGVTVRYYEQVSAYDLRRLQSTPFQDASGGIGLVGTFPEQAEGGGAEQVRLLLATSAGGIHPRLDINTDEPVYVVNQIQGLVQRELQPEYADLLQNGGLFWRGTLLRAHEAVARKLGLRRIALHCPYGDTDNIRRMYAQTAKKLHYKKVAEPPGFGPLWVKDLF